MTENATAEPVSITITDIRNLLAIIDVASKRGAFHTKEFGAISEVYNKVELFVSSQEPVASDQAQGV